MLILTLLLLLVVHSGSATQICDKDKGPLGSLECLMIKGYLYQYQWATCMTKAYIQDKSRDKLICDDPSRNYCWYQCMLEVYHESSGYVKEDCSCDPYGESYEEPTPTASEYFFSDCQPGMSYLFDIGCYWYRKCLAKKNACNKPSDNGYAIRYTEKFCRVAQELRLKAVSNISSEAQTWLRRADGCGQHRLAIFVQRTANPSCKDIREKILASYSSCYLKANYDGGPSICYLNCWEYFKIFWTIRGTFPKLDTAWETLKGLWNIRAKCTPSKIYENDKCFERYLKGAMKFMKLNTENLMRRKRRSSYPLSKGDTLSRFADAVGSAIASTLKWNTDVMDWIAYTPSFGSLGNLDIVVVLADKKALGIVTGPIPPVDLDQIVQDFASAVRKGTLRLQVDGYNVWVKSLSACHDKSCDTTWTLATSSKPPWNGASRISHGTVGLCGVIAVWIMVKDKLFF